MTLEDSMTDTAEPATEAPEPIVLEETADGVRVVTLNRPDRRNGWSPELEAAYFAALDRCDADDEVKAVVVTGVGRFFCPGLDLTRLAKVAGGGFSLAGRPPQYRPRRLRKPLIAAINGACAGIGLVQALQADVRFCAEEARFSTAFARRGLAAEYAISWVLSRYVGVENALDLLLSARTFDAAEAHRLGLVSRLLPRERVLDEAVAYARDLAANCAPAAMAAIKHQVYTDLETGLEDAMARSLQVMVASNTFTDLAEGVAAPGEKRPPRFAPLSTAYDADEVTGRPVPGATLTADDVLGTD
ncbi:enoyl-CoA hydratase-related protein [Pseudonocardia sp. NPDC049154]|uniref:enoyl-CoA hydratase-related protein n=1 Tax=Pseudonocardia sp. NPDC049154 TaxID=3155501 RepID=UPI0033E1C136